MTVVFCDACGFSLSDAELISATSGGSGRTLCGKCRAPAVSVPQVINTSTPVPANRPTRTLNLNAIKIPSAVQPAAEPAHAAPSAKKKTPITMILGGVVALLVVVAGILMLRGVDTPPDQASASNKPPTPPPPVPPTPPPPELPSEPKWAPTETDRKNIESAARLLDEAEEFKFKNPQDVKGFRERVEKVISFYVNTPAAGEAARMLGRVRPDKPDLIGAEKAKVAASVETPELPKLVATETDKRVIEGAAKLLDDADEYKKKFPDDVRGFKTRLEKIVTFYSTTPAAVEAVRMLATIRLPAAPAATATGLPIDADWGKALNLYPLFNPANDIIRGKWRKENDTLIGDPSMLSHVEFHVPVPEEYDFKIVFTRMTGESDVNQMLSKNDRTFMWSMGCDSNKCMRLETFEVPEKAYVLVNPALNNGQRYTSIVQVRNSEVRIFLDGKLLVTYPTNYSKLRIRPEWALKGNNTLGVGGHSSLVHFHELKLLDAKNISVNGGRLKILSAIYGDQGKKTMDVTAKVRAMLKDDALAVNATNDTFGDPAPGDKKSLRIEYSFDGSPMKFKEANENEQLKISNTGE